MSGRDLEPRVIRVLVCGGRSFSDKGKQKIIEIANANPNPVP